MDVLPYAGSGLSVLLLLLTLVLSPRRIVVAAVTYMALRNNDRDLAIKLSQHVFKAEEDPSAMRQITELLPKGGRSD